MKKISSRTLGLSLFSFLAAANVWADVPREQGVRRGAELRDVLAAWGEPAERIERSVKKELVWRYPKGAYVVFKEGRVSSFKAAEDSIEEVREKKRAAQVTNPAAGQGGGDTAVANDSKDMLRDIVREIPSGADVPYTEPPPGATGGLVPNPVPPIPGGGGQPIAPGQVVPSLEED